MNIAALAIRKDGSLLGSGSRDYDVKTWDTTTGTCVDAFKVPRNIVTSMAFDKESGNILFQGSEDLSVRGWDVRLKARQPVLHLKGYVYFPLCMDLDDSGNRLATGCKGFNGSGCEVKVWDLRKAALCGGYQGHTQDVRACIFLASPSGTYLMSASSDGSVGIWDAETDRKVAWVNTGKLQYTAAAHNFYHNSKSYFFLSAADGSVSLGSLDLARLRTFEDLPLPFDALTIESTTAPYRPADLMDHNGSVI